MREPATSKSLLERMARAGYEEMVRRKEAIIGSDIPTWEEQTDEMREEYLALAGAIHQSLGNGRSRLGATANGGGQGRRSFGMPVIACAIVLAFLGGFATAFWTAGSDGLPRLAELTGLSPAISTGTPIDTGAQRPGTNAATPSAAAPEATAPTPPVTAAEATGPTPSVTAPEATAPTSSVTAPEATAPTSSATAPEASAATPSVTSPEATAPTNDMAAQERAAPSPSHGEPTNQDRPAPIAEKPEPPAPTCTVALDPWPADATAQGKAIQALLRDLGFYKGPVSGTVGPLTRAAIRKFQLAAKEAATGEPSKSLFESLKKKKCASTAP